MNTMQEKQENENSSTRGAQPAPLTDGQA